MKHRKAKIVIHSLMLVVSVLLGFFGIPVFFMGLAISLEGVNLPADDPVRLQAQTNGNIVAGISIAMVVLGILLFLLNLILLIRAIRKKEIKD